MTYEQLLQQIRANAINFIAVYQGADEVCQLTPFYNAPITADEHEQILALMPEHGPDLAVAIFLNKAEVCIDQANHAPYHTYFGNVQRPHYRCSECGRIRARLQQQVTNKKEFNNGTHKLTT